jgi:predicted RNA polymerase sigma factor
MEYCSYRSPPRSDFRQRVIAERIEAVYREDRSQILASLIRWPRKLTEWLPGRTEAEGLLAFLLLPHSRRNARRSAAGDLVPHHAVATAYTDGWQRGIKLLEAIAGLENYFPYQAARAQMLKRVGRLAEANVAFDRAISLTSNRAEQEYLSRVQAAIRTESADH